MAGVRRPPIIKTRKWGAKPAAGSLIVTGRPDKIIFHHSDGHHPEIQNPQQESREEAKAYARSIQAFHMGPERNFIDSGHNFLVCRNGLILVGRHLSMPAINAGRMILSAHCPGQNDQPGIEHEHKGEPRMTAKQLESSARLHAWIMSRCDIRVTDVFPHKQFIGTECPAQLLDDIDKIKARAARLLNDEGRDPASELEGQAFAAAH